jgi:hypothetical protein
MVGGGDNVTSWRFQRQAGRGAVCVMKVPMLGGDRRADIMEIPTPGSEKMCCLCHGDYSCRRGDDNVTSWRFQGQAGKRCAVCVMEITRV